MSRPHGHCRACQTEVWAASVRIGGHQYWVCGECSGFLVDVSWEEDDAPKPTVHPKKD